MIALPWSIVVVIVALFILIGWCLHCLTRDIPVSDADIRESIPRIDWPAMPEAPQWTVYREWRTDDDDDAD